MATIKRGASLLTDPVDILLADVGISVQLSSTDYDNAVARYRTIKDWIKRDDSSLRDCVDLLYPQGSMAVGATIASRLRTDEFDIDVVAQLNLPADVLPKYVLDLLYRAIKGSPGSRYYKMTKRRTRCITIQYSDNMHLDVTPAVRLWSKPERESLIFHHRPEMPQEPGCRLIANPYGFAEWFLVRAEADRDPVPSQEPTLRKSKAVIVLQLLKRWRNVQYDARPGRRPPSIMIAKLLADAVTYKYRLSEELLHQARHMRSVFQRCLDEGRPIRITNPICKQDVLTDRWPGSHQDQVLFMRDLDVLVDKLERLVSGCDLGDMQSIMVELFGETPTKDVFAAFNRTVGDEVQGGRSRYRPETGGLVVPATVSAGIATPAVSRTTPKHTFYGGEQRRR